MHPEVVGALIGSGTTVFAGIAVMAIKGIIYSSRNGNGNGKSTRNTFCAEHNHIVEMLVETHNDVKWLCDKTRDDTNTKVLQQILCVIESERRDEDKKKN